MKNDFKYFYDKKHDKYGIRVDGMSLGCSFELLVAANVFEMQDTLRYKNISKNDLENNNSKLYIDNATQLEKMGFLLLKSEMFHRVAYPETAISGLSPCITDPDGAAARDIANIVKELETELN